MKFDQSFFLSDPHFGSPKVCKLRGYDLPEDFVEAYVKAHNETVKQHNCYIIAGDIALNWKWVDEVMPRLKGSCYIALGNHDYYTKTLGKYANLQSMFLDNKYKILVCHMPMHRSAMKEGWQNWHGHLHSQTLGPEEGNYLNLCPEIQGIRPKHFTELYQGT